MEFLKSATDAVSKMMGMDVKQEAEKAVQEGKEQVQKSVESGQKGVMEKVVDFLLKSFPEPFRGPIKGILKTFGVLSDAEKTEGGKFSVDFKKSGAELATHIKELRGLTWGASEVSGMRGQLKGVEPRILAGLFLFEEGKESEGASVLCAHPSTLPEKQSLRVDFPEHNKKQLEKAEFTLYELIGYDKDIKKVLVDGSVYVRGEGKFIQEGGEREAMIGHGTTVEVLERAAQTEEEKNKENEAEVKETTKHKELSKEQRTVSIEGTSVELKALESPDSLRAGLLEATKESKDKADKNLSALLGEKGTLAGAFEGIAQEGALNAYQQSMLMLLLPGLMKVRSGVNSTKNGDEIGIMGLPKELYTKEKKDPKEHIGGKGKEANRAEQIAFVINQIGAVMKAQPEAIKNEANAGKQLLLAVDALYGEGVGQQALGAAWKIGKGAYAKAK